MPNGTARWVVEVMVRQAAPPDTWPPATEDGLGEWPGYHHSVLPVAGPLSVAFAAYRRLVDTLMVRSPELSREQPGAFPHFPEGNGYVRLATAGERHHVIGIHVLEDGIQREKW